MKHNSHKLVAIVGPTGSGKTSLSIDLASEFNGEVLCADSRTLYRGMDVATAKPTIAEQLAVPHHLLDVAGPGEIVTAAEFKRMANAAINDVTARGRMPFIVGGSGLYLDSVLFDYNFPPPPDAVLRHSLNAMGDKELAQLLLASDANASVTIDMRNRRRVIRAIESAGQAKSRATEIRANTLVLGLAMNKEIALERLSTRLSSMFESGLLDEARIIGAEYGWDHPAVSAIGYGAFRGVFDGTKTLSEAHDDILSSTMAFYKRQMTWFRRNSDIRWLTSSDEARSLVRSFVRSGV